MKMRHVRKKDDVKVFKNQAAKDADLPETKIQLVGYSRYGWEHYVYRGVMYKGFVDPSGTSDACIILTEPLLSTTATASCPHDAHSAYLEAKAELHQFATL